MFCPKCSAQNVESASFCRVCGANISLVTSALTGQLPAAKTARHSRSRGVRKRRIDGAVNTAFTGQFPAAEAGGEYAEHSRRRSGRKPCIDGAVTTAFAGLAFFVVTIALAFSEAGNGWWFWMLIPAFSCLGSGLAQYVRYKEARKQSVPLPVSNQGSLDAPGQGSFPPARPTAELMTPPPSVTEGTTRHLGAQSPARNLGSLNDGKAAEPGFSFKRT